ncbi:MAG: beta-galactosidase, partial [Candidatus Cyclobacteriaceae bacterium M3_2C_046]
MIIKVLDPKTSIVVLVWAILGMSSNLLAQWNPQGEKIKSSWAENINPDQVWQEYPRPIMERKEWLNLNGLWQYAILPA